jgi:hypothetical protein
LGLVVSSSTDGEIILVILCGDIKLTSRPCANYTNVICSLYCILE